MVKGDPEGGYIGNPEEGDDAGRQHAGIDDINVIQHNGGSAVGSPKLERSGVSKESLPP